MFFRKAKRIKELERENEMLRASCRISAGMNKALVESVEDCNARVLRAYVNMSKVAMAKKGSNDGKEMQVQQ